MNSPSDPRVSTSKPLPRPKTIFSRALRLRCPACGGRPVLLSWLKVAPNCPTCGFRFDRHEPGYWIGSYSINIFATEGVFAVFFVFGMVVTWPDVPWTRLLIIGLGLAVVTPFIIFPYARMLYLALDLSVRPPELADLADPAEPSLVKRNQTPRP